MEEFCKVMKIKLTNKQVTFALSTAIQRHNAKHESFRNKDTEEFLNKSKEELCKKAGVDVQYMSHYIGVLGELAWAIATGQEIDKNIYSVRDSGEDFAGVEIKTITYFGEGEPELKIPVTEYEKRTNIDIYVLARVSTKRNEVELLGMISKEDFDKNKQKKRYSANKPLNYVVPLCKMRLL